MLSTVAIITAWCGFEASKWGGEMSIAFSQAFLCPRPGHERGRPVPDARMFDLVIWANYVQAVAENKTSSRTTSRPGSHRTSRPPSRPGTRPAGSRRPLFANPAYVPAGTREAAELNATADAKFAQALENNQRGDNLPLLTQLFAPVLFLTAMSQRAKVPWANWVLLGLAIAVTLVGAGILHVPDQDLIGANRSARGLIDAASGLILRRSPDTHTPRGMLRSSNDPRARGPIPTNTAAGHCAAAEGWVGR